ncbi:MAG: hypothetical protein ACYCV7_07095 [Acidimicrobiales bacterium]
MASPSDPNTLRVHNGHHPEIDVYGDGTATGTWYLSDRVIAPAIDFLLEGTSRRRHICVRAGEALEDRALGVPPDLRGMANASDGSAHLSFE